MSMQKIFVYILVTIVIIKLKITIFFIANNYKKC